MAAVNGFDCEHYPGDAAMAWLRLHGQFRVTGFYLTHWPAKPDQSWIKKRATLAANGWGFIPTYVGLQQQSSGLTPANASTHAQEAVSLLKAAGFAKPSVVYLDLESGDVPVGAYAAYIASWVAQIKTLGHVPAIYCSHLVAPWALGQTPIVWSFHVPAGTEGQSYDPDNLPSGLIDNRCIATQYRQNIKLNGLTIPPKVDSGGLDLNLCSVSDPSSVAAVHHMLGL